MRTYIGRAAAAAILIVAATIGPAALAAAPDSSPDSAPRELTKSDADAWLDGFMPFTLESNDIAGAVVIIVKDGQVPERHPLRIQEGHAQIALNT